MTAHANYHTDSVIDLLTAARTCLAEGDLMQASAKAWGAAEQMVKAVAESRGWDHADRGDLYRAVDRLEKLSPGEELQGLFLSTNALHQNAYEDDMPAGMVADGIDDVEQFAAALEPHLP